MNRSESGSSAASGTSNTEYYMHNNNINNNIDNNIEDDDDIRMVYVQIIINILEKQLLLTNITYILEHKFPCQKLLADECVCLCACLLV